MVNREQDKQAFLQRSGWGDAVIQPIAGDASFRRYARLTLGEKSAILMDAPPEKEEVQPFITVDKYLREQGLSAPEILAEEASKGFLVLEDLGNDSFSAVLSGKSPLSEDFSETQLYERAIDALIHLHKVPVAANLPAYDEERLLKEAMLLIDWYFPVLNGEALAKSLQSEYVAIWKQLLPLTKVLSDVVVLRDYHADNLMWLPERRGAAKVGLLDFQDAVIGSPAYDMVSILEDARRDVGAATVDAMITRYLAAFPNITRKDFLASYAILGAQRNCKIIGIFSRLAARDNLPRYLKLLPRVWGYIDTDLKHPLLQPLKNWMDKVISPHIRRPKHTPLKNGEKVHA